MESISLLLMADDSVSQKLDAVTTFKLTTEMSEALNALKDREGCSKDAMIRRLLQYGMKVYEEMERMGESAATRVASHETRHRLPMQKKGGR